MESSRVNFIPTKEVRQNLHQLSNNIIAVKAGLHEAITELTKCGDIKLLGGIAISGKEVGGANIGENGLGFPSGLD